MIYRQTLYTEIEYLKGVGPKRATVLQKELQIFTLKDLLNHFPFRYVDKTKFYKVKEVRSDSSYIQIKGEIENLREAGSGRSKRLIADLTDNTGSIELVWFKGTKWIINSIKAKKEYLVYGKPSSFRSTINIVHPEIDLLENGKSESESMKFQPVYNSSEKLASKGLSSRGIMKLQKQLFQTVGNQIPEVLPDNISKSFNFITRIEAYKQIHFPENIEILEKAKNRLKFEELFFVQVELCSFKWKKETQNKGVIFSKVGDYFNNFFHNVLPFELTNAQKRVIKELRSDFNSGKQMNRLLQGDVGSGKTIVALMAMFIALDNGFQTCIMAPTEILAKQHFNTISKLAEKLDVKVVLLTGSTKKAERKIIDEKLRSNETQILIGTHALIEDTVKFNNLGFVVIDEQHRFGVAQRAKMWKKSTIPPHILVMTATPIPRTLAMTFYGDLNISVIDEMPPGRKEIITKHYFEKNRLKIIGSIRKIIKQGNQVYIVYPLIEESEKLDYKNLMEGYDLVLREFPRPEYQLGIMHGKMKTEDKDKEMQRFVKGELDILVSTTVIEVGVDVPNATVMVIESAEKFGLSQLHQLRGRVGRGGDQSYCILMTSYKLTNDARTRMKIMTDTNDGFRIAEADLKLRGPGEVTGTKQSGIMNFKIADLATDHKILEVARKIAIKLIEDDPNLSKEKNKSLKNHLKESKKERFSWVEIS